MPMNWKEAKTFERLLAAIVATGDIKGTHFSHADFRQMARLFGQDATYDSIEKRFRIIKREAAILIEELENGTTAAGVVPAVKREGGKNAATANKKKPAIDNSDAEAGDNTTPTATPSKTPKTPKTPRSKNPKTPGKKVQSGRVSKNKKAPSANPSSQSFVNSPQSTPAKIKNEDPDEDEGMATEMENAGLEMEV